MCKNMFKYYSFIKWFDHWGIVVNERLIGLAIWGFLGLGSCLADPPGKQWFKVWADEFKGTEVNEDKWRLVDREDWNQGNQVSWFKSKNVKLDGEHLCIENHWHSTRGENGETFSGGWIDSKEFWTYGYFEARIKLEDDDNHFWPTFWMWKWQPGEQANEFDIMELSGWHDTPTQSHHTAGKKDKATQESGVDIDEWHEWGVLWSKDEVTFYIDGRKRFSSGHEDSAVKELLPIIFTCTPNREKHPKRSGTYPRFMIDWVRVWKPAPDLDKGQAAPLPVGDGVVFFMPKAKKGLQVARGEGALNNLLVLDGQIAKTAMQSFEVEDLGGGLVALKTQSGKYLSVDLEQSMRIYASADEVGDCEKFEWVPQKDGMIALKSCKTKQYCSINKKKIVYLSATASKVGVTERFAYDLL